MIIIFGSVAAPVRQPRPGVPALVRGLAPAPRARQLLETRGHVARVHAHPARPAHSLGAHARHLGAGEDSRVPQPGHHVTCHVSRVMSRVTWAGWRLWWGGGRLCRPGCRWTAGAPPPWLAATRPRTTDTVKYKYSTHAAQRHWTLFDTRELCPSHKLRRKWLKVS